MFISFFNKSISAERWCQVWEPQSSGRMLTTAFMCLALILYLWVSIDGGSYFYILAFYFFAMNIIECIHQIKYFRYFTLYPSAISHYYDQQQGQTIFLICWSARLTKINYKFEKNDFPSSDKSMSILLYCIVLVQLVCHAPRIGLNIYEIYQVSTRPHA